MRIIADSGLKHTLILTGYAPGIATIDYLCHCCAILKKYFSSIAIEIYSLAESECRRLIDSGVDGLTISQEKARSELDWSKMFRLAMDSKKQRRYRESSQPEHEDSCTMCGKMCAVRNMKLVHEGRDIQLAD